MTAQTPATAEMEKWLRIRCQAKFLTSAKFLACHYLSVTLLLRIKI